MVVTSKESEKIIGVICGVTAFLIWGFSPIYWKQLKTISSFEILMHRMLWSFVLLFPLLIIFKRSKSLLQTLKNPGTVITLLLTTLIVGANWFLFIWAINNDMILQTSMGYYITPLVNVLLGIVFLKERLRFPQLISFVLASIGVFSLILFAGIIPWIALFLAISFGFYGLIRKIAAVAAIEGLCIETFLLAIPAAIYLIVIDSTGNGALFRIDLKTDLLLIGSALVTGLPLLLFIEGSRRIKLSTVGFLQYLAPSCSFLLAIFLYHEPINKVQVFTFVMIWLALTVYTVDSIYKYRNELYEQGGQNRKM